MKTKRIAALGMAAAMMVSVCGCAAAPAASSTATTASSDNTAAANEKIDSAAATSDYVAIYPIVDEPITVTGLVVDADTSVSEPPGLG